MSFQICEPECIHVPEKLRQDSVGLLSMEAFLPWSFVRNRLQAPWPSWVPNVGFEQLLIWEGKRDKDNGGAVKKQWCSFGGTDLVPPQGIHIAMSLSSNISSFFLKSRNITLPTKVCRVKAMVFLVVVYGCESWTIKKAYSLVVSCVQLCNPMDYRPSGSYVHGIIQVRILECVAISFSRETSQPRDWT